MPRNRNLRIERPIAAAKVRRHRPKTPIEFIISMNGFLFLLDLIRKIMWQVIVKASLEHDERMTEKKLKSRKFDGNGGTNRATCHITEIIQYVRISSDSSHGVLSSSIRSVDLFCLQSHIHVRAHDHNCAFRPQRRTIRNRKCHNFIFECSAATD